MPHVVAMTGDGVNDAPALRLADVGVALAEGRGRGAFDLAVAASAAFAGAAVAFPPLQRFLGLAVPTPFGLALCAGAALASVAISRALAAGNGLQPGRRPPRALLAMSSAS